MSADAKKTPGGLYENAGIIAVGGLLFYKIALRIGAWFSALWHVYPASTVLLGASTAACGIFWVLTPFWNRRAEKSKEKSVTAPNEGSVFLGTTPEGEDIHISPHHRVTHTQVIGTTSAGKTESVTLPWAIRDLESETGMLIIDGKSDRGFLEKFYAYVVKYHRRKDFRLFSLASPEHSTTFNPLAGGTPYEITERVFSSFTFTEEFYKNVQYQIFHALIRLVVEAGEVPTFILVRKLLRDRNLLTAWLEKATDPELKEDLQSYLSLSDSDRFKRTSGLDAHLSHFTSGELGRLFNTISSEIQMDDVLANGRVCYFQLPSMLFPELASATGKLVLQAFQSAVARRHVGLASKAQFFSCFLDDFQDYIYEGFGSLLNKSRSANVGVVFAHQSLGDLEKVSPAFKKIVLTNTNIKCVMRCNDPETCDHFSESFGTQTIEKVTERQKRDVLGESKTGDGSVRAAEEFIIHPNDIRNLGTGEGVVSIPHFHGVKTVRLRFKRREDIDPVPLPKIPKGAISLPLIPPPSPVPPKTPEPTLVPGMGPNSSQSEEKNENPT